MGFLKGVGRAVGNVLGVRNPAKDVRRYLEPIEGYGRQAYDPYIQQAKALDPQLQERYQNYLQQEPTGTYGRMSSDPTGFINAIMEQYAQSPDASYRRQQLSREAANTAAAGGYSGTMGDIRQRSELIDALIAADQQRYLQNVLGVQGGGLAGQQYLADKGLAGLEGVSNRGFTSASALADYLGSAASQRAGLEFGGKQVQMGNFSNLLGSLIAAGASMYGAHQGAKGMESLARMGGGTMNRGGAPGGSYPNQNYITAPGRYGAPGAFRF